MVSCYPLDAGVHVKIDGRLKTTVFRGELPGGAACPRSAQGQLVQGVDDENPNPRPRETLPTQQGPPEVGLPYMVGLSEQRARVFKFSTCHKV